MQKSVLPAGWDKDLYHKADLEYSFRALRDCKHFYAEVMRGLIRSLQLRANEADKHFDKASDLAVKAPETVANLIRQFTLHIYRFHNILLHGPISPDPRIPDAWLPELSKEILHEYPELKQVINLRRRTEGVLRLHLREYDFAARLFEELIEDTRDDEEDKLFTCYIGLAAAQHNLGRDRPARRNLDSACLTVQAGGSLLNRARAAGVLRGYYSYLDDLDEAESWEGFLGRLNCPRATKQVFLALSDIIEQRCKHQSSLVLL